MKHSAICMLTQSRDAISLNPKSFPMSYEQCCGSGSGRIRTFLLDQDVWDPDPMLLKLTYV
jgi:hypothetical protein